MVAWVDCTTTSGWTAHRRFDAQGPDESVPVLISGGHLSHQLFDYYELIHFTHTATHDTSDATSIVVEWGLNSGAGVGVVPTLVLDGVTYTATSHNSGVHPMVTTFTTPSLPESVPTINIRWLNEEDPIHGVIIHSVERNPAPPPAVSAPLAGSGSFTAVTDVEVAAPLAGSGSLTAVRSVGTVNNFFADAIDIGALWNGTYTSAALDNTYNTSESGEPNPGSFASARSSWWKFTPANTGILWLSTSATTYVAVYSGSAINALTRILPTHNDSSVGSTTTPLPWKLTAGTTYYFQVGSAVARTTLVLTARYGAQPSNDDFANATDLGSQGAGFSQAISGDRTYASPQASETSGFGNDHERGLWWKITPATADLNLKFSSVSTNRSSLWRGTTLAGLTLVNGDLTEFDARRLQVGETYYIRLGEQANSPGTVSATVTLHAKPANDDFADATNLPLVGGSGTIAGTNQYASTETGEASTNPSLWWRYTPQTSGTLVLTRTSGSGTDPEVAVYTGAWGSLTTVQAPSNFTPLSISVTAGTTYHIRFSRVALRTWTYSATGPEGDSPRAADLIGSGALSAAVQMFSVEATAPLAGAGNLSALVALVLSAQAPLTGSGSLTAVAESTAVPSITGPLVGGGAFTAVVIDARLILVGSLTSTSALTAQTRAVHVVTAGLVSAGQLSAVAFAVWQPPVSTPTVRWKLRDTSTAVEWTMPINPDSMSSPLSRRVMKFGRGWRRDARVRTFAGPAEAVEWEWSGAIRSKDHYDRLVEWAEKSVAVDVTDHLGRTFRVFITEFNPSDRRPTPRTPWRLRYTMKARVLERAG